VKKLSLIFMMIILIVAGIGSWNWYESISSKGDRHNVNQEDFYDNGRDEHLFGKHMYLDAKVDEFDHLEDVEATADEIVVAKKIAQDEPTILYGKEDRIDIAYTLSTFRVQKSISGAQLKQGETFTMLENEAYDKKQDVTYHIAGYNLIDEEKDYLLFLRKSETDSYYIVAGINYGKVDLEREQTDYPEILRKSSTEYSKEIISAYNHQEQIRQEAKNKYAATISEFVQ